MKSLALLMLIALLSMAHSEVIELTDDNFDSYIKENPHVLVMFYAKWCGHCKSFMKTYSKLAASLEAAKDSTKIVKIDADLNRKVNAIYKIRGFPTFKYFNQGKILDF